MTYPEIMTEPRQLDAATDPCQMRLSHNPTPIRTQSHHRFPSYLQRRLWGEERLDERLALCGTDHDSLHTWISVLLGEQYQPQLDPGRLIKAEAQMVVDWYTSNGGVPRSAQTYGSGLYGSGPFGGGDDSQAVWDGLE